MLRRALTSIGPRLFTKSAAELSALSNTTSSHFFAHEDEQRQPMLDLPSGFRTFATSTTSISNLKDAGGPLNVVNKLSMTPNHKIQYDQHSHKRFPPGTEGRPFAYFVQTAGRFLYASSIRLVVIKLVLTLSPAADTLAVASIEVDFSNLEEGQTMTAKWRGKPVFIMHRRDSQIEAAEAVPMSDLKDPQTDKERVVDPKFLVVVGLCTHLGCVPIAGAGNYGGWFCPCHGSHYDTSGRARQGPAPTNLEVPEYKFIGDRKITIG